MPVDYHKYYEATNKFNVDWTQNREVHTTGSISTYGGHVSGNIGSYARVLGYKVVVTYDGPINIGDRKIREEEIPNYWDHDGVRRAVQEETGIIPMRTPSGAPLYSSAWMEAIACMSLCCCCGAVYCCCREPYIGPRKRKYEDSLERIASDRMASDVARIVQQADESVNLRLEEIRRGNIANSSTGDGGAGGTVTLSADQFQRLLTAAATQLQNNAASNSALVEEAAPSVLRSGSAMVILPQYDQRRAVGGTVDVELADQPTNISGIARLPVAPPRKQSMGK